MAVLIGVQVDGAKEFLNRDFVSRFKIAADREIFYLEAIVGHENRRIRISEHRTEQSALDYLRDIAMADDATIFNPSAANITRPSKVTISENPFYT